MKDLTKLPLVEMLYEDDEDGTFAISVVDRPATKSQWIALQEQKKKITMAKLELEDKRIVLGAILIPNQPIYRVFDGKEVNIFFSEETVRKTSQMYLKNGNQSKATIQHGKFVNGVTLTESWIVEDTEKDKSALYGLELPVGTWAGSMKIDNEDLWEDFIKTGVLNGFSIEGSYSADMALSEDITDEELFTEIAKIVKKTTK